MLRLYTFLICLFSLPLVSAADSAADRAVHDNNGNPQQYTPLALEPGLVCNALIDEGLHARGGYKEVLADDYRCSSKTKRLNAGGGTVHEITFYAKGSQDRVNLMGLDLAVHSKQNMQRAHRIMKETAERLTQRTLQMQLPEQVALAIMGAVSGRWSVEGRLFSLRRMSLPDWGHELMLVIR